MTKWIFLIVCWLLAMRSMISILELMDIPQMKPRGVAGFVASFLEGFLGGSKMLGENFCWSKNSNQHNK